MLPKTAWTKRAALYEAKRQGRNRVEPAAPVVLAATALPAAA